jgi:hypothetical protein
LTISDDDLSAPSSTEVNEPAPALADDLPLTISDGDLSAPTSAEVNEPAPAMADDLGLAISDDDASDASAPSAETTDTAMKGGTVRLTPKDILAAMASSVSASESETDADTTHSQQDALQNYEPPQDESGFEEKQPDAAASSQADAAPPGPDRPQQPPPEAVPSSQVTETQSARDAAPKSKPVANTVSALIYEQPNNENSKLKVQLNGELLENLTIEEVMAMVEAGKIREHNKVARQFSENWVEAHNVPVLRPIFNRLSQERIENAGPPPMMTTPPKRGLFNRLFGRNRN